MKHTITDWLSLHELDLPRCQAVSQQIRLLASGFYLPPSWQLADGDVLSADIPIERAWSLVCDAYAARYQNQDVVLGIIASEVPVNVCSQANAKNFVTDRRGRQYPEITLAYRGRPLGVLALAHEFAHATQCVIAQGRFVAPAFRELCAFNGELILLEHLLETDPSLFREVAWHWLNYNNRYLNEYLTTFDAALSDVNTQYRYEWNYPIARFLSICDQDCSQPANLWADFSARESFGTVLDKVDVGTPRYSSIVKQIISS